MARRSKESPLTAAVQEYVKQAEDIRGGGGPKGTERQHRLNRRESQHRDQNKRRRDPGYYLGDGLHDIDLPVIVP